MYQLGLADVGPRSNRESLSARLEALGETPARKSARYSPEWRKGTRAGEELSKLRTVKLPRFSTKRGSAEYFVLLTSDGRVEDVRMISGDEYLKEAGDHLRRATYNQSFPASSKAKILRKCIVMCSEIPAACSAVLMTPDMVSSVE